MGSDFSVGDVLGKVDADIARVGWSVIGVFAAADDEPSPQYLYSIGFTAREHPEFLVMGLGHEIAHSIVYGLWKNVTEEGKRFADRDRSSEVLQGYDVEFRSLPPDGRPANVARRYYGVDELDVLQVVWPDAQSRFPWEPECEWSCVWSQNLEAVLD